VAGGKLAPDEVCAAVWRLTHQLCGVGDVHGGMGLFYDVLLSMMSSTHLGEEV